MQNMSPKWSIFILGTTAVGKTKLSLEIAKYLKGSIISTDSKQLYCHANLMTAKASKQEQNQAKHYMIDAIKLQQSAYNRNKFYAMAKNVCNQIWKEQDAAIFVGGTNYYVQPLLYQVQELPPLLNQQKKVEQTEENQLKQEYIKDPYQKFRKWEKDQEKLQQLKKISLQQKYSLLCSVDKLLSEKIHKNDEMRVTSFLQRYYQTGIKPSQNYKPYSTKLNNPNTIVFWVRNSDKNQHETIVTKRIHKMMQKQGIIQILSILTYLDNFYFLNTQSKKQIQLDNQHTQEYCKVLQKNLTFSGIGQSIGYKQFFPFYFQLKQLLLSEKFHEENQNELELIQIKKLFTDKINIYQTIQKTFQKGFKSLKQSKLFNNKLIQTEKQELIKNTMHYCKKQITWIRNRIFQIDQNLMKKFYILQLGQREGQQKKLSIEERFQKQIKSRAIQIIQSLKKQGQQETFKNYQTNKDDFQKCKRQKSLQQWKKYRCQDCQVQSNGIKEWQIHLESKRHQKMVKTKQKRQQNKKWIEIRKKKSLQDDKQRQISQQKNKENNI